jgi:hypothetical protein
VLPARSLVLPIFPDLMGEDVEQVCQVSAAAAA